MPRAFIAATSPGRFVALYLATRVHNTLTPRSLRVRLAMVTYADTDAGKKPFTRLGIFFEDIDDLAKRMEGRELPVRRSRGYAPYPVKLPVLPVRVSIDVQREDAGINKRPTILAAGAELKNAFCVTRDGYAFLSQHVGDLENYETLRSFEDGIAHFERLFRIKPQIVAYDLHPNYLATRYALERAERDGLKAIGVQHHHAHIAACLAENNWNGNQIVIGVAFDGTGYGLDGALWGGEFLVANYREFERVAHLDYMPLPGGDAAIHHLEWRARGY